MKKMLPTSVEASPPRKRAKVVAEKIACIKKIRLDNLVVYKCVSFMRQKFSDDFSQKLISLEFSDAIQFIHSKLTISISIRDSSPHFKTDLLISTQKNRLRWNNNEPVVISLANDNIDKTLEIILRNIFTNFRRLGTLDLWWLCNEATLLSVADAVLLASLIKLDRLKIGALFRSYCAFACLLQKFSKFLKDIFIYTNYQFSQISEYGVKMKQFFAALARCQNLQRLHIHHFEFSNSLLIEQWSDFLAKLKIKQFKVTILNEIEQNFDDWLFSTLGSNENVRNLTLPNHAARFFCSSVIKPILHGLHSVGILVHCISMIPVFRPDKDWKQNLMQILNCLHAEGILKIKISDLGYRCNISHGSIEKCKHVVRVFNVLFEVSELTRKLIKFYVHMSNTHRKLTKEKIIQNLRATKDFREMTIVNHAKKNQFDLCLNNARILLCQYNSLF